MEGVEFAKLVPALWLPEYLRSELGYTTHARVSLPVLNEKTTLNRSFDSFQLMDKHNDMMAMLDTMVAYLWPEGSSGMSFVDNEIDPARGQMGLDLVFKTTDGYITAGAVSDAEWKGMCRALNREDMLEDPLLML